MRKPSLRRLAVTSALVIGSLGASAAMAQWTTSGTGTSEAKSLTAVVLTVTARTATADLYPGFVDGDVYSLCFLKPRAWNTFELLASVQGQTNGKDKRSR